MVRLPRHTRAPLYLAAAAAFAACSTEGTNPTKSFDRPLFAVGGVTTSAVTPGVFKVCKSGSDGVFSVAVTGGQVIPSHVVTVLQGTCQSVAEFTGVGVFANVTVTETSPNFLSATILGNGQVVTVSGATTNGNINFYHGATVSYVNSAPTTKKCDADKTLKDPKIHDENHDCRSENGEENDKKHVGP
ncbi:MAG: hypothetical protein ACR2OG_07655 [Gemmatimonadaceae bacterium]